MSIFDLADSKKPVDDDGTLLNAVSYMACNARNGQPCKGLDAGQVHESRRFGYSLRFVRVPQQGSSGW
jgi:hypothetical protein